MDAPARGLLSLAGMAIFACFLLALAPAAMAKSRDRNRDAIPDSWERAHSLSVSVKQANKDPDHDGLTNLGEYRAGTNPHDADSDNDGAGDADEDRDRDHVDNANEMREKTRPDQRDSDRDGKPDGREDTDHDGLTNEGEDMTGNDPINPDTDGDGFKDGDESAGQVASFKDDMLTIRLFTGGTIKGLVTDDTDIFCDDESGYEQDNGDYGDGSADDDPYDGGEGGDGGSDDQGGDATLPAVPPLPALRPRSSNTSGGDGSDAGDGSGLDGDCGPEHLIPGVIVHDADVESTGDGRVFDELDLLVED